LAKFRQKANLKFKFQNVSEFGGFSIARSERKKKKE
jgi:hypothetical protein